MKKIIIITGQTATGKTSLALQLAKEKNGELVNFDSRQMYKYLTIITGKDIKKNSKFKSQKSKLQLESKNSYDIGYYKINGINVWLYDAVDPKQNFSSFDFKELAEVVIEDIQKRNKIPILIGGTYLYLKHLLYGFETENIPPNWPLRKKLNKKSLKELQKLLKSINYQMFQHLNNSDKNNPQRLIRKIEIATNLNLPAVQKKSLKPKVQPLTNPTGYVALNLRIYTGLRFASNDKLKVVIKKRVLKRLQLGAIDEVKSLLDKGYKKTDPGMKTIGYQQIIEYLEKKISKENAVKKWITAEIQYAKRQYTFMKKDENIVWRLV
ncbi:hypothetical protein A3C23_00920 [Candidatus Roizmanbacteria bacterium RIFCSPHIGHO2_02_FULL_37_13b]|uniref:tRNA dimethylallyltransferase n=1 Tax=Candidatus Roizmanbacteria bacterium RIFCSPLOWO2_02_FULL_36_11 TaxID=1802071 RepID=A0A1F7JIW0_9BACT|nr:MAG: hypothetical protein A3C23_00920 [Candidatus Roizmanbacteria bacterium RIFCSPHIGHO2_02_FULL_37_13b]OGK55543.1 MAG: hypothetical protein A3H78_05265 [Candidatus Roizmanbacteria bacterium RIFCSPLOWO2_02_FULL_36_11]